MVEQEASTSVMPTVTTSNNGQTIVVATPPPVAHPAATPVPTPGPTPVPQPPSCVATLVLPDNNRQNTAGENRSSAQECLNFCQLQVGYTHSAYPVDCAFQGNFLQRLNQ